MKCHPLWLAAIRGDDVYVRIPVVLASESDPFPIGRKSRIELVTHVGGQPSCRAAVARGNPQIARISKDHFVFRNVSETE